MLEPHGNVKKGTNQVAQEGRECPSIFKGSKSLSAIDKVAEINGTHSTGRKQMVMDKLPKLPAKNV
jgi:hypothetical protein